MRELIYRQDEDTPPPVIENSSIEIQNLEYDYFNFQNVTLNNCEITPTRDIKTLYFNNCCVETVVINLGKITKISLIDVVAENIILKCNTTYKLSHILVMTSKIGKLQVFLEEPSDTVVGNIFVIELSRHRRSSGRTTTIKELLLENKSERLRTIAIRDTSTDYIDLDKEDFVLNTIDYAEFKNLRVRPSSHGYTLINKVALLNGSSCKSYDSGLPDITVDLTKADSYSNAVKLKARRELNLLENRNPQRLLVMSAPVNNYKDVLKTLTDNNPVSTFLGLHELLKETILKHGIVVTPKITERYYPYIKMEIPEEYTLIYSHRKTYNVYGSPVISEDLIQVISNLIPRITNSDASAVGRILLSPEVLSSTRIGYVRDLFSKGCLLTQDSKYLYFYKR